MSRDAPFPAALSRGDEAKGGGSGPDSRAPRPITRPRDMYEPDLHIDTPEAEGEEFSVMSAVGICRVQ